MITVCKAQFEHVDVFFCVKSQLSSKSFKVMPVAPTAWNSRVTEQ